METATKLQEALEGQKPVLVEFYADWCPHCQRMMPVIDSLRQETGAKAEIIQVNGDQSPDLMRKYHIDSYPTWIIFKDGEEAWRDSGDKPLSELKDMINRFA